MAQLLHKILLLLIGFTFCVFQGLQLFSSVPFLLSIMISSYAYIYPHHKFLKVIQYAYVILACFQLEFLFYLPLIFYDVYQKDVLLSNYIPYTIPYIIIFAKEKNFLIFLCILYMGLAVFLKRYSLYDERLQKDYLLQRDASKELALLLQNQNKDLMIKQEYEIKIATLNERNRIAREIHDNVGHLLSSSLLQVGAIQTINKEVLLKEPLQDLRNTISVGMDNVRSSVHDLHDDSIDLEMGVKKLISSFTFCKTSLEYDILHPFSQDITYHILAILKEAFNNTMKHSNATMLTVILREQPKFYQLIIHDNGTKLAIMNQGIGLKNIAERINSLHGYCNINHEHGFQIFVTLPKEEEYANFSH